MPSSSRSGRPLPASTGTGLSAAADSPPSSASPASPASASSAAALAAPWRLPGLGWVMTGRPPAGQAAIREGVIAIGPTLPGIFCWGIVTGIAMVKAGLSIWQALAMSLVMYAGTAQLAVLPLLASGAGLPIIWLTGLLANLRFVIYSATSAPLFRRLPPGLKAWVGYHVVDSGLAVYLDRLGQRRSRAYPVRLYFAIVLPIYLAWHLGSLIGIFGAPWIAGGDRLGFIGILAIAAICGTMLRSRVSLVTGALAALTSIVLVALPLRLGLFAAVLVAMAAAPLLSRWLEPGEAARDEAARDEAAR